MSSGHHSTKGLMCPTEFGKAFLKQVVKWHPPDTMGWSFFGRKRREKAASCVSPLAIPIRYPFPGWKNPIFSWTATPTYFYFYRSSKVVCTVSIAVSNKSNRNKMISVFFFIIYKSYVFDTVNFALSTDLDFNSTNWIMRQRRDACEEECIGEPWFVCVLRSAARLLWAVGDGERGRDCRHC